MSIPDNCILWTGTVNNKGYGVLRHAGRFTTAHRIAWEREHGPIADGLQIDHLCRERLCVNVDHLELVTARENTRRAPWTQVTHCKNGHPLTGENLHIQIDRNGWRHRSCVICRQEYAQRRRAS